MRAATKYRVKVRLKVRNRIFKSAGFFLSVVAAAGLFCYCCVLASRLVRSVSPGRFFSFTARSVTVAGPSQEISAEISRRVSARLGRAFSREEADELASGLRKSYPALSRVEVKRNFVNGRVAVEAASENVVARVLLNGKDPLYLSESGRLLGEYYGVWTEDALEINIHAQTGLGPLAAFLKEFKTMLPDLSFRPVKLECPVSASCRLTLENSAEVLWGEFEFTRSKILRLNEVLADASRKIKAPLKVDFRYFRDGKVFVSKLTDI